MWMEVPTSYSSTGSPIRLLFSAGKTGMQQKKKRAGSAAILVDQYPQSNYYLFA